MSWRTVQVNKFLRIDASLAFKSSSY